MSNLINASTSLVRLVDPEAGRLGARNPALARRLKRAAERAEDAVTDAACELGRARKARLRDAQRALVEVRGCLQAARDVDYSAGPQSQEALALASQLLDHVDARMRSA